MAHAFPAVLAKSLPAFSAEPGHAYRLSGQRLGLFIDQGVGAIAKAFKVVAGRPSAVLTYPGVDYDGDSVNPEGGDWSDYPSDPVVNWEHTVPVGRGIVSLKSVPHETDGSVVVPVGTTKFFERGADLRGMSLQGCDPNTGYRREFSHRECLEAAAQNALLVSDGLVTGVSMEFRPAGEEGDAYWARGPQSLLLNRKAFHFENWQGLGYAHALRPKNPNAQTITADVEKCMKAARDGAWADKPLGPLFLKAFAPFKPASTRTTVRVETKAMPAPTEMDDDVDTGIEDGGTGGDEGAGDTGEMHTPPTAAHGYDAAQQVEDALSNLEANLTNSEAIGLKKKYMGIIAKMRGMLAQIVGHADDHVDTINSANSEGGEGEGETEETPEGGEDETPEEPEVEPEEPEGEEDDDVPAGLKKSFTLKKSLTGLLVTKSGYAPKGIRFKASQIRDVPKPAPAAPVNKALENERRLLRKRQREARQLLK